jgi:hypothetical protein
LPVVINGPSSAALHARTALLKLFVGEELSSAQTSDTKVPRAVLLPPALAFAPGTDMVSLKDFNGFYLGIGLLPGCFCGS